MCTLVFPFLVDSKMCACCGYKHIGLHLGAGSLLQCISLGNPLQAKYISSTNAIFRVCYNLG